MSKSVNPWTATYQASLSFTVSQFAQMSTESVSHPTISSSVSPFSSCPQSFPASMSFPVSQLFSSGSQNISFNFSFSPSDEYSGLISFRIDWFDLLVNQGTLKNLLQHHSLKASVQHSDFFMVQFSHLYMTTGKTIALNVWTSVSKMMSLLFNT